MVSTMPGKMICLLALAPVMCLRNQTTQTGPRLLPQLPAQIGTLRYLAILKSGTTHTRRHGHSSLHLTMNMAAMERPGS